MKLINATLIIVMLPLLSFGQQWEAGVTLGLSNYQGDLVVPSFSLKELNFGYGAFVRKHINDNIAIKGFITGGKLSGNDSNFDRLAGRAYSFEGNFFDFGASAEYHFWAKPRYDDAGLFQKRLEPYVSLGLGMVYANPETFGMPSDSEDLEKDFSKLHLTIPISFGIKYDVSEKWTLGAEASWRPSFSDYLDGISQSANPDNNDWYFISGISLSYWFGEKDKSVNPNN